MIEKGDVDEARRMAERSASRRRVLTVGDAVAELPDLDTAEHIRLACQQIQRWAVGGLLPGVVVNGCIRAAEVALRALDHEMDVQRIKQLEARVKELEAERSEWRLPE